MPVAKFNSRRLHPHLSRVTVQMYLQYILTNKAIAEQVSVESLRTSSPSPSLFFSSLLFFIALTLLTGFPVGPAKEGKQKL